MQVNILTIFPDFFKSLSYFSMVKRAIDKGKLKLNILNLRDFSTDRYKSVDDRPFGGGPGMVLKFPPIFEALKSLDVKKGQKNSLILLTSAFGPILDQKKIENFASLDKLTIICGHYQGVDARVDELIDGYISIGKFILQGGETAAFVIVDAISRILPDVLNNEMSLKNETYSDNPFVYPLFTRPREYKGYRVPDVLLTGDHKKIKQWREQHQIVIKNAKQSDS